MSETPIHPLQAMLDGMNAAWQQGRSTTQLTLGRLITILEHLDVNRHVVGLGGLMSYRGYYCDLAFAPIGPGIASVRDLLTQCRDAMGRTFTGYKGGEFLMGETTPLWVAPYGSSGERFMGLNTDENPITIQTAPEES